MKKNIVQTAIDSHLSSLELTTYEKRELFDKVIGETKMKRKRPAIVVMVAVLVLLLASVAIAISYWNPAVEHTLHEEVNKGSYEAWAVVEKLNFLDAIAEYGIAVEIPDISSLSDEEADSVLTQYIQDRFGGHSSSLAQNIADSEYGMFETWSLEDKAGYTQLLYQYGLLNPGVPVYYVPEEGSLTKEQVKSIAYDAIRSKFTVDDKEFDGLTVYYSYYADAAATTQKTWQVDFRNGNRLRYSVKMSAEGVVNQDAIIAMQTHEEIMIEIEAEQEKVVDSLSLQQSMEAEQGPMYKWSLEDKAKVFPDAYGIPSTKEVQLDRAFAIARETAKKEYGWTDEKLSQYELYAYFCIGRDAERNYYVINFFKNNEPVSSIEIYADDGSIKAVYKPTAGNG